LNADGTISGAITGTWLHRGNNLIDLVLSGTIYYGVFRCSGIRMRMRSW